jgi:hypothetical protein
MKTFYLDTLVEKYNIKRDSSMGRVDEHLCVDSYEMTVCECCILTVLSYDSYDAIYIYMVSFHNIITK